MDFWKTGCINARRQSPEHHAAAIAVVVAISLVLIQTISDRVPSNSARYASRTPKMSCRRTAPASISAPAAGTNGSGERVKGST
jgi:hypothetical protein